MIALDEDGRPSFNILQNYGSSKAPVLYSVFDVIVIVGRDVMREPLEIRRALLKKRSCRSLLNLSDTRRHWTRVCPSSLNP